jgi:glutathione S-transferase
MFNYLPAIPNLGLLLLSILFIIAVYYGQSIQVTIKRIKAGIKYPAVSGEDQFERVFRAHYNSLENIVIVIPLILIFGFTVNMFWGAIAGFGWGIFRIFYAIGYSKSAATRHPAGGISSLFLIILFAGSLFGLLKIIFNF